MASLAVRRSFAFLLVAAAFCGHRASAADAVAPKVLVVTMFGGETAPWTEREALDLSFAVPGLSRDYPAVACSHHGLCVMTTAMGFANAAASVSAVVHSELFDLRETYVIVAGIAGVDPSDGTLGSAHWARYVIDGDLRFRIDPRQIPLDWPNGVVALGAKLPGEKPVWKTGTEIFTLNEALVAKAYELTQDVPLADSDEAKAYRATYPFPPANAAPLVSVCDTVSGDTYWHGSLIAESMTAWAALLTGGKANYCTTQMEDNATLTALRRGADAGLVDFKRVAVLRTGANFDREAPGQTAAASLVANSGGIGPAIANAYRVASTLAHEIISNWSAWRVGVPAD